VWTLFGVVHFAYMCSTRSISCLSLLCAPLVVNPLLKLLNLDQTCLSAICCLIWSPWAFASTCMCCYMYMIASVRASFQSTCYNLEASAFVHFCIHSMIWGGVVFFELKLDKCMCQQGGEVSTLTITRGEYSRGSMSYQIPPKCWVHVFMWEIAFVQGELHLVCFC
jgi:hypothetical protein